MQQNKLSSATRKRLPKIIEGLLAGKTHQQITASLGLKNRSTIERDLRAWRETGGYEEFLHNEWLQLHGKIKESDPVEAYRQISKLLGKTLTQKIETELTGGQIVVKMWKPEEKENASSK